MPEIARGLERIIEKPLGAYRPDAELKFTLRRRLTKKEYRILLAEIEGTPSKEALLDKLRLEPDRYDQLRDNVRKKLNLDSIKRELFSEEE